MRQRGRDQRLRERERERGEQEGAEDWGDGPAVDGVGHFGGRRTGDGGRNCLGLKRSVSLRYRPKLAEVEWFVPVSVYSRHVSTEPRALRADAERNRRRLLDAARTVFAREGLGAGVDAIAREAGVGVGTLYRRFPTKQELLDAVIEDGVTRLACEIEELHELDDAERAFTEALNRFAGTIARDRGFFDVIHGTPEFISVAREEKERLMAGLEVLLKRAQDAGAVRDDVVVHDVPALCMVAARLPAWRLDRQPELWTRYLGLLIDGLRPAGASELGHEPPLPLLEKAPRSRRRSA